MHVSVHAHVGHMHTPPLCTREDGTGAKCPLAPNTSLYEYVHRTFLTNLFATLPVNLPKNRDDLAILRVTALSCGDLGVTILKCFRGNPLEKLHLD